jgi:hypothetical protein
MTEIDEKLKMLLTHYQSEFIRTFQFPEDDFVKIRLLETVDFFYGPGLQPIGLRFENSLISDMIEFLKSNFLDEVCFTYSNHGVNVKSRLFPRSNLVLYGSDWFPTFHVSVDELELCLLSAKPDQRGLRWAGRADPRPMLCNIVVHKRIHGAEEIPSSTTPKIIGLYTHQVSSDGSGRELPLFKTRNLNGAWPEGFEIHEPTEEFNKWTVQFEEGE